MIQWLAVHDLLMSLGAVVMFIMVWILMALMEWDIDHRWEERRRKQNKR